MNWSSVIPDTAARLLAVRPRVTTAGPSARLDDRLRIAGAAPSRRARSAPRGYGAVVANTSVRLAKLPSFARAKNGLKPPRPKSRPS